MLAKCKSKYPEIKWYQRFGDNMKILKICHHMLTSPTQLQNRSFHVAEKTRTATKCTKMKIARVKRQELLFFIVKYANLWRSSRRRGCLSSLVYQASTKATATTTPENNDLIGWTRKNNRAARAARTLLQLFDVVCQTTTWNFQFKVLTTTWTPSSKSFILYIYFNVTSTSYCATCSVNNWGCEEDAIITK